MKVDEFLDLARNRRSIRKFKSDPVPDEHIQKILESARWAMSGANAQPWEFIIIEGQETKKKLAEISRHHDEMNLAIELTRSEEFRKPRLRAGHVPDKLWIDAPVIIAVLGDKRTMLASTLVMRLFELHTFDHNMANTTHMIHLAAAALGLGAEWISIDEPMSEEMKHILGIPAVLTLFSLVPIGYPAHQPASYRRELDELVHHEKYDMSKFRSQDEIKKFILDLRKRHLSAGSYPVHK